MVVSMSEADILEQIMAMRLHLDATIAQVIGITFTLILRSIIFCIAPAW